MTVREYNVIVRVRVATYASDMGVKMFANDLADTLLTTCMNDEAIICEHKPQVEVNYDTRT